MENKERETLGEVLAESVIGLSRHEMSGKGKKNKKKDRRTTRGSKEGKAERVREPPNRDAQGLDSNQPPDQRDSRKPPEDGDSNKLPEEGQQRSDKA